VTQKLVSVITPCYNADKYIAKLLDSVLGQTYDRIEMIIVDDGSTDSSAEIIKSYSAKFKKRGFNLEYVYQKNQGQSGAINAALKMVKGDYLVWPDADDYYSSNETIEKLVHSLDTSDDSVGMSRVELSVVDESGKEISEHVTQADDRYKTNLFESCLFEYGSTFWGAAGGYMIKMSHFDKVSPRRDIYTERSIGQNWQLCLPVLYEYKCLTVGEKLYTIVARRNSHSRRGVNRVAREKSYYRTIQQTLNRIDMPSRYRRYLLSKTKYRIQTIINKYTLKSRNKARFRVKRGVKLILPYGVVMFHKRRKR